jgi:hypothetical protein
MTVSVLGALDARQTGADVGSACPFGDLLDLTGLVTRVLGVTDGGGSEELIVSGPVVTPALATPTSHLMDLPQGVSTASALLGNAMRSFASVAEMRSLASVAERGSFVPSARARSRAHVRAYSLVMGAADEPGTGGFSWLWSCQQMYCQVCRRGLLSIFHLVAAATVALLRHL